MEPEAHPNDKEYLSASLTSELAQAYQISIDGVEITRSQGGYSLAASKDLGANYAFASIPFTNIINFTNLLSQSPIKDLLQEHKQLIEKEGDQLAVVLHLMWSKKHQPQSQWLKASCSTFLSFEVEHIQQTGDEQLLMDYRAAMEERNRLFDMVYRIVSANSQMFGSASTAEWRLLYDWAVDFLTTRAFGYGMKETALIPIFDCLNHTYDQSKQIVQFALVDIQRERSALTSSYQFDTKQEQYVRWSELVDLSILGLTTSPNIACTAASTTQKQSGSDNDSEEEEQEQSKTYPAYTHVVLATSKPCQRDEELYLHYGCRNNAYLLRWYGFCLQNNPYDSLLVWLSHTSEDVRFDAIERPSTKFKLKWKCVCLPLINWYRQHFYESFFGRQPKGMVLWTVPKNIGYELYLVERLLNRLKQHKPQTRTVEGAQSYVQYLNLYGSERSKLYDAHIHYLTQLSQWLGEYASTKKVPAIPVHLEPYCRGFLVAMLN